MSTTGQETMLRGEKCYACGKPFRDPNNRRDAFLIDDGHRAVPVGPECFRKIVKAGDAGHKPPNGGPRLFLEQRDARAYAQIFGGPIVTRSQETSGLTIEPDPRDGPNSYTVHTAGWLSRFAKVDVGIHRCGHIEDGISLDLADCEEPNHTQWHPGGIISFADLEAIYLAAKKVREVAL